jgi:tRNA nucleotidyltransferase (CCA-adding enzyme)
MFDHNKIPKSALEVVLHLKRQGWKAYLVGGCVRDLILGREPNDWDVATNATPEDVMDVFPKTIPTGILHGTVTVIKDGDHIEVTTFRTDGDYKDGRRPESVRFEDSVEADLSRRDFTINAIAYDPFENVLVDPFGGQVDIEHGIIRAVGNPMDRFTEDGLRPMRAVRFAAQLGFEIETETFKAITNTLDVFKKVAKERIQAEFTKLVTAKYSTEGVKLLVDSGLSEDISRYLMKPAAVGLDSLSPNLEVRLTWLGLLPDVLQKLKYSNKTIERVRLLQELVFTATHMVIHDLFDVRRWVAMTGPNSEVLEQALEILVHVNVKFVDLVETAHKVMNDPLTVKQLAVNGNDLKSVGIQGKMIGSTLNELMIAVFKDPSLNTKESLLKIVNR